MYRRKTWVFRGLHQSRLPVVSYIHCAGSETKKTGLAMNQDSTMQVRKTLIQRLRLSQGEIIC